MGARSGKDGRGMLRQAILEELERRGLTKHWLAHEQKASHPGTCLAYLYCGRGARAETVEGMLEALGLVVVPAAQAKE